MSNQQDLQGSAEGKVVVGNISFSVVPVILPKGAEISKVLTEDDVRRIVREEISKALKGLTE